LSEKKEIVKQPNAIMRFYRETAGELRKVTWPTREEAKNLTLIVLVVLVAMAIFLGAIDFLGAELLNLALGV
jgi:preprotein translocase subunit SecE